MDHGFVNGYFLSIKIWYPNFVALKAKKTKSAIWIRLPELQTEFCDHSILARIGKKLGELVKTDVCTSETLRERYAIICVEVPIGVPVQKYISIGHHKQPFNYKCSTILCARCGVLGHTIQICPKKHIAPMTQNDTMEMQVDPIHPTTKDADDKDGTCQIVSFAKKNKQHTKHNYVQRRGHLEAESNQIAPKNLSSNQMTPKSGINVNFFHVDPSNFLETKTLKYRKTSKASTSSTQENNQVLKNYSDQQIQRATATSRQTSSHINNDVTSKGVISNTQI
ncbi:hypothetical protein KY285_019702 [Solanum tuberosum]|nr:hypothetical protein KY284_019713 [Solanum tuberosum]KAH0692605.1 hypothetical protein KY285_019702 [Solanum tuberosum]